MVLIAVAEFENGDLFYDLDATDVEIVENEKGTSSSLEVARIPTTSLQASDVPFSGRLHNLKQYVNHIDNKITGGYSLCVGKKAKKSSITKYHYYLNKGNFPQYSAWARRHNQVHGKSGDDLVLIAVAEFENGDLFYDLDDTDVEIVENEKGTSDHLEVARVPNTSLLNGEAPFKGRLNNLKQYVNHIDNKITGGYSLCVGKKAKNWKSLPGEWKFKSVLDGRMRCELDAHQYRLSDKLHSLVYPQPEDYEKLEPYYNEIIALVEYFTDSTVGELKKRFDA